MYGIRRKNKTLLEFHRLFDFHVIFIEEKGLCKLSVNELPRVSGGYDSTCKRDFFLFKKMYLCCIGSFRPLFTTVIDEIR